MDIKTFQKESYVFMIDSSSRNKDIFPESNQYSIEFNSPFLNVCAMEILRAHIPRSEYNIDDANNVLEYTLDSNPFVYQLTIEPGDYSLPRLVSYLNERLLGGLSIATLTNPYNVSNKVFFNRQAPFSVLPSTFCEALGMTFLVRTESRVESGLLQDTVLDTTRETIVQTATVQTGASIQQSFEATVSGLLKEIRIVSSVPSTSPARDIQASMSVKDTQGALIGQQQWSPGLTDTVVFDSSISVVEGQPYTIDISVTYGSVSITIVDSGLQDALDSNGQSLGGSLSLVATVDTQPHALISDSLVDLTGFNTTVFIRCKEIEQVVFRERFGETTIHSGMGYVKMDTLSTNTTNLDYFQAFPPRELSLPLARLKRLSFSLETRRGMLYNTRKLDHQIVCRLTYYKAPASM